METQDSSRSNRSNPPLPIVQSFLACRRIFQDRRTGHYVLIEPINGVNMRAFPAIHSVALYLEMVGVHGDYELSVQLRDQDGETIAESPSARPPRLNDPLIPQRAVWDEIELKFPKPGRYDLVVTANGEDLAHRGLLISLKAG